MGCSQPSDGARCPRQDPTVTVCSGPARCDGWAESSGQHVAHLFLAPGSPPLIRQELSSASLPVLRASRSGPPHSGPVSHHRADSSLSTSSSVTVRRKHHLRERTHRASSPRTSSPQALPFTLLDEQHLAPSLMEVMNVCSPQLAATFPASHHLLKSVRKREALCHVWNVLGSEMSCSRNAHKSPNNQRKSGLPKRSAASEPVQNGCR